MPLDLRIQDFVVYALGAYANVLFLRIIVSLLQSFAGFSPPPALRPVMNFLYDTTEPFLRLFRRLLPTAAIGGMGLDISPILAFLVLRILAMIVASIEL